MATSSMAAAGVAAAGVPLRIAVVGSGISGLSCAWLLAGRHAVTLYERADRLGGHSNTVTVAGRDGPVPVDTGFIVYNEVTYPNLTALFAHLGVATKPSDMSFSASLRDRTTEYCSSGLTGLFAQPSNAASPRFWSMLRDLARFQREAGIAARSGATDPSLRLGEWLRRRRFGQALIEDHLLPMAAAIWSSPTTTMLDYPAASFLRFFANHGLLHLVNQLEWRTVEGGSRAYVERLRGAAAMTVRGSRGVRAVERTGAGVIVRDDAGGEAVFDHVVIATHADQALAMLAAPTAAERRLLGAFRYSHNLAVLHMDEAMMPRRRRTWSSWNYLGGADSLYVTYWMNRLQSLPGADLFVTLNPPRPPRSGTLLQSEIYEHPVFDADALHAQERLWSLQGEGGVWFCGAHFGAGFHEDGLQAGLAVAEELGGVRRPWTVADENGRIRLGRPAATGTEAVT